MQRLLIADGGEAFCSALQDALKNEFRICICKDGEEVLANIQDFQPDVMWLDINLCKVDGITVIERAAELGCYPLILIAGCYFSEYSLTAMERYGVAYMMSKPCKLSAAISRLRDIAQWNASPETNIRSLQDAADDLLISLHFRAKLVGDRYLREALQSMATQPGQAITKEVYPAIAAKFGTNAKCVERVIRGSIKDAWDRRDDKAWATHFVPDADGFVHCPSNGTFMIRLADELRRGIHIGVSTYSGVVKVG